ncbi:Smy2p [Sugiyamaella lignohabitans]|uniref:Smy2p n=1 Tax=Sugiyamaella lignohabitans TaxID=796027 RepID=A0A167ECW4_9ASCO|nr:Smy2p [Sugiyamaella lignohabitans]ANB13918.1 Smy2p [Sugiyamaella lignohabitans]
MSKSSALSLGPEWYVSSQCCLAPLVARSSSGGGLPPAAGAPPQTLVAPASQELVGFVDGIDSSEARGAGGSGAQPQPPEARLFVELTGIRTRLKSGSSKVLKDDKTANGNNNSPNGPEKVKLPWSGIAAGAASSANSIASGSSNSSNGGGVAAAGPGLAGASSASGPSFAAAASALKRKTSGTNVSPSVTSSAGSATASGSAGAASGAGAGRNSGASGISDINNSAAGGGVFAISAAAGGSGLFGMRKSSSGDDSDATSQSSLSGKRVGSTSTTTATTTNTHANSGLSTGNISSPVTGLGAITGSGLAGSVPYKVGGTRVAVSLEDSVQGVTAGASDSAAGAAGASGSGSSSNGPKSEPVVLRANAGAKKYSSKEMLAIWDRIKNSKEFRESKRIAVTELTENSDPASAPASGSGSANTITTNTSFNTNIGNNGQQRGYHNRYHHGNNNTNNNNNNGGGVGGGSKLFTPFGRYKNPNDLYYSNMTNMPVNYDTPPKQRPYRDGDDRNAHVHGSSHGTGHGSSQGSGTGTGTGTTVDDIGRKSGGVSLTSVTGAGGAATTETGLRSGGTGNGSRLMDTINSASSKVADDAFFSSLVSSGARSDSGGQVAQNQPQAPAPTTSIASNILPASIASDSWSPFGNFSITPSSARNDLSSHPSDTALSRIGSGTNLLGISKPGSTPTASAVAGGSTASDFFSSPIKRVGTPLSNAAMAATPPPGIPSPQPNPPLILPENVQWVYKDPSGVEQGPFSGKLMHDWYTGNWLKEDLLIKRIGETDYITLHDFKLKIGNFTEPFRVPLPPVLPPSLPPPFGQQQQQPSPFGHGIPYFDDLQRDVFRQHHHQAQQPLQLPNQHQQFGGAAPVIPSAWGASGSPVVSPGPMSPISPWGQPIQPVHQPATHSQSNFFQDQPLHSQLAPVLSHSSQDTSAAAATAASVANSAVGSPVQEPSSGPLGQSLWKGLDSVQRDLSSSGSVADIINNAENLSLNDDIKAQTQAEPVSEETSTGASSTKSEDNSESKRELTKAEIKKAKKKAKAELQSAAAAAVAAAAAERAEKANNKQEHSEPTASTDDDSADQTTKTATSSVESTPVTSGSNSTHAATSTVASTGSTGHGHTLTLSTTTSPTATAAPALAPWAKKDTKPKALSLKEIQELEASERAKQTAKQQELVQQQLLAARLAGGVSSSSTSGPILPSGAKWASSMNSAASPKKTLAEIQREEELAAAAAAKKKAQALAQAQAQTISSPIAGTTASTGVPTGASGATPTISPIAASLPFGKKYAEIVTPGAPSSVRPGVSSATSSSLATGLSSTGAPAWTTVGPGGRKVSSPATTGVAASIAAGGSSPLKRAISSTTLRPAAAPVPTAPRVLTASDEFLQWCKGALQDLNAGINQTELLSILLSLPATPDSKEIIAETIYSNSSTMDGRRFADEFLKKRNVADKEKSGETWSDVLQRNATAPPKPVENDGWNPAFKVVKKKNKRADQF